MGTARSTGLHKFNAEYLSALKERDEATETHFFSYFNLQLQTKLRRCLSSWELMNDVRQETLLRVFTAIHSAGSIRKPECLGAFVHSVCNNVLLESFRAGKRYCSLENIPVEPADETASAEQMLVDEETHTSVHETLWGLPQKDEELLQAVFIEERDRKEMCRKLGIRRDCFRLRLHRAKRRFLQFYGTRVNNRLRNRAYSAKRSKSRLPGAVEKRPRCHGKSSRELPRLSPSL